MQGKWCCVTLLEHTLLEQDLACNDILIILAKQWLNYSVKKKNYCRLVCQLFEAVDTSHEKSLIGSKTLNRETWDSAFGALWTYPGLPVWTNELMTGWWSSTDESFRNHLGWIGAALVAGIKEITGKTRIYKSIYISNRACVFWSHTTQVQPSEAMLAFPGEYRVCCSRGRKTLTQLTLLELLCASKGLQQPAAHPRWRARTRHSA